MKLLKLSVFLVLALFVVSGCAKKADPNYAAALEHAKVMSKEENRSVKTFEITGANISMNGVTGIIVREPMPTPDVRMPTTWKDVAKSTVDGVMKNIPIAGKFWLGYEALQTAETLAADNVHIVEQPAPTIVHPEVVSPEIINAPDPVIVQPVDPGDINVTLDGPIEIIDVTPVPEPEL